MNLMHDPGPGPGTPKVLRDLRFHQRRSIGRVLHKKMNDDLPIYPTPQQATYTMAPGQASRRNNKPYQSAPPPSAHSHQSSSNGYNSHNPLPPPPQDYYQPRPYQAPQTQHHVPPNQTQNMPQNVPQNQPQYYQHTSATPHYQTPPNSHQNPHANSHTNPQNGYQNGGYQSLPPQPQHRPSAPQQYYNAPQPTPVPRASSSSSHYGSAPQQPFQGNQYQPPSGSSGGRSASYAGQQFAPSTSPTAAHTPPTPSVSTRPHPSKKPPSSVGERSRENLDEPPKTSSKQRLEAELRATFDRVDTNHSGRISARELSAALINFDNTGFQHSTVRLMIKLFSSPAAGVSSGLNFEQFVSLWKYLTAYKKLFVAADVNKSGDISFGEFQRIIEQIGYKLNVDLVLHLFQKFANKESHDDGSVAVGKLKFDAFIELLVYLRKLTDIFKQYDKQLTGVATIDYSDFLLEISNLT